MPDNQGAAFQLKLVNYFSRLIKSDRERLSFMAEIVKLIPSNNLVINLLLSKAISFKESNYALEFFDGLIGLQKHAAFDENTWKM